MPTSIVLRVPNFIACLFLDGDNRVVLLASSPRFHTAMDRPVQYDIPQDAMAGHASQTP
jgi:hypothetical protein